MLTIPTFEEKERPVLNSSFIFSSTPTLTAEREFDVNTLIYWIKRTPECIGIIKRIATDIVTSISFVSIAEQKTGRPSKTLNLKTEDRANYFWNKNMGKQKLMSSVMDWLMTGDAYLWKGRISESQIKESILNIYSKYGIELKEIDVKQFFDEDWNGINSIEVIPSSMVKIKHDDYKILKYVQKSRVDSHERIFDPSEVIHAKLMELDGKVYGYTPMQASYIAMLTVNAIQDYGYNYFANGVKADRVWKFMGNPSQSSLDKFEEQLARYKSVRNSHGDFVLAGADKIESEKLNEVSEEMEYRQLAIHSVGRLAFAFNMPADILSSILGVDIKGTAGGSDIEDAGYNRNIIQSQEYWELLLNTQLWMPEFKVEMRLERTFRQDQIRQIQYQAMAIPVLTFLFQHEIPVSDEYIYDALQIPRKYLTEGQINREGMMAQPFQLPNDKLQKGQNSQNNSNAKKSQQEPQSRVNPPSGA